MVGQATLANELARRITGEGSEKVRSSFSSPEKEENEYADTSELLLHQVISQILHSTDYSSLSQRVRNIAVQSWTIAFQHVL